MKRIVIYGPPGTGKTTQLLDMVDADIEAGIEPERIAFVSFTKAAVTEAMSRAAKKFNISQKRLRWFRTLHSLAYTALGLSREVVLHDYTEFAEAYGFNFGKKLDPSEVVYAERQQDDLLLHARSLVAATEWSIERVAKEWALDLPIGRYHALCERLEAWKKEMGQMEYADMLQDFIDSGATVDAEVAYVDEAQDLTPVQWRMVWSAFRNAKRVVVAGDDDQAIYHWAGADVTRMLGIEGEQRVLAHSYRLPRAVHRLAHAIAERIATRKHKVWSARDHEGMVGRSVALERLPLDNGETWALLSRTSVTVPTFAKCVEQQGLLYRMNGAPNVPENQLVAVKTLRQLRAGATVPINAAKRMCSLSSETFRLHGAHARAADFAGAIDDDARMLGKLPPARVRYLARVHDIDSPPRVALGTIHQSKGTEAENVVLSADMTRATEAALRNPTHSDHEHRVMYVGATRARGKLFLLRPDAEYTYKFS